VSRSALRNACELALALLDRLEREDKVKEDLAGEVVELLTRRLKNG
jgi:hypothetical protein